MKDDFGDRMKAYEAIEDRTLDAEKPIYVRIDGRSFSRFTRGMGRPFDTRMSAAMISTTKRLVDNLHPRIGYTQSDEISLVWLAEGESQPLFGGRIMKLASICAGLATAAFNRALMEHDLADYADRLPHFDARVVQLPDRTEAANMFLWRERDATRNAISMTAQINFSHRQLQGRSTREMRAMLCEAGVNFDALPHLFRHGTFVRRETIERPFTHAEWEAIPLAYRAARDELVRRSIVRALPMPDFGTVSNRESVVFDGADALAASPAPR